MIILLTIIERWELIVYSQHLTCVIYFFLGIASMLAIAQLPGVLEYTDYISAEG